MSKLAFDPSQTDWNLIRSFVAVVEHGSLTRAAEAMGLSQPTLSRQIAELESSLGAALFERVARGLKLTPTGENLVEPARYMMAAARSLGMAAATQNHDMHGTVRITASEMVSAFVLPALLRQLAQLHPEIQIELVASNQISNLLEREADIAIRMVRPAQSALIARHLTDWPIAIYAHRDYLAELPSRPEHEQVTSLAMMQRFRWLGLDQSEQFISGFRAAGLQIDRSFFDFRCDNYLVNWHALQQGLGVGITMRWLAERSPDLEQILVEQDLPSLPVWLTTHRELKSSKRIRTVFDFLAEGLQHHRF
ncbi:LysR family transcriptional regulator [Undibacterium umbellatum]|uniref:LysR family transcriptional regulator n=1 Tax=Undibacterium umbellatum TaxID=2762300 RepID=A0ABR6ZEQ5_9BURK|nr:LysR family transcriptional regulator [Undibacterium umbellatum]MBC3910223.1 LysR family transcriptional regulator [Undibacterium umbellatum]